MKPYRTIAPDACAEALFEDRKSQFFGFAVHAESADEAVAFRHDIMKRIPHASHYVSAWVLADGSEFYSDAKEPHGTAGLPVLNAIKGRELADVACVVARVFGGTLLGKGGLMRAYTKAASDALDTAHTVLRVPSQTVHATVPYALYEPITKHVEKWGATLEGADFTDTVKLHLVVPADSAEALVERMREFTNASAVCTFGDTAMCYLPEPATDESC